LLVQFLTAAFTPKPAFTRRLKSRHASRKAKSASADSALSEAHLRGLRFLLVQFLTAAFTPKPAFTIEIAARFA